MEKDEIQNEKAANAPTKSAKLIALQEELAQAELEAKKLEIAEKKLNLTDIQERLDDRKLKRDNVRSASEINGQTLKTLVRDKKAVQARCNHRKGGNGAAGIVGGQGDSGDYAVIRHTFGHGDTWVICTRCGKTWTPVTKEDFESPEEYAKALVEYERAMMWQTKNSPSSAYGFKYSDNGAYARQMLKNTVLR